MVNANRRIVDPKDAAIRLECRQCGYESVARNGVNLRLVSRCPHCGKEWNERRSNTNTAFNEFVYAMRTLWNINEEDDVTFTVRLEFPID